MQPTPPPSKEIQDYLQLEMSMDEMKGTVDQWGRWTFGSGRIGLGLLVAGLPAAILCGFGLGVWAFLLAPPIFLACLHTNT